MSKADRVLRACGWVCLVLAATSACFPGSNTSGTSDQPQPEASLKKDCFFVPAELPSRAALAMTSCEVLESETREQQEQMIAEMRHKVHEQLSAWREQKTRCQQTKTPPIHRAARYGAAGPWTAHEGVSEQPRSLGLIGTPSVGESGSMGNSARSGTASGASSTNVQVPGVDEADIVKNDEHFVYLAVNGALRIISVDTLRLLSVTKITGIAREMFLLGDRVALYVARGSASERRCTYGYDCQIEGDGSETALVIYDVSDRESPRQVRSVEFSGSLIASRRVGPVIHTVVTSSGGLGNPRYPLSPPALGCEASDSDARAAFERLELDNERLIRQTAQLRVPTIRDNGVERELCDAVFRSADKVTGEFTSVVSLLMNDNSYPPHSTTIATKAGAVYASSQAIYLSATSDPNSDSRAARSDNRGAGELTRIHRLLIGKRPESTIYSASGEVPGHVLNQFSMDEWNGSLRIATTLGRTPNPSVTSQVSILVPSSGRLVQVGAVTDIARGEDIRSVRFEEDRGYLVTFKKTDPLFVLDLSQSRSAKILGELEIPGFSTYMHRLDANHLLSIGFDANDHGNFAYFDGVILQLFDVADPIHPKLMHKEKIGTRGSSSEAATNHLAFNYSPERGLLALPMAICEGGGNGQFGEEFKFGGLLVYNVSPKLGFQRLGDVDHGQTGNSCRTFWSQATSGVKRSLFIGDLVFSIALDRVKVQRLSALGRDVADISLR